MYWETCSFRRMNVSRTSFRVINVTLSCDSAPTMVSACDWSTIGDLADAAAKAQLGGA